MILTKSRLFLELARKLLQGQYCIDMNNPKFLLTLSNLDKREKEAVVEEKENHSAGMRCACARMDINIDLHVLNKQSKKIYIICVRT